MTNQGEIVQNKGIRRLIVGGVVLAVSVFVLPTALFEVFTGRAEAMSVVLFVIGAALLVGGLYLVVTGLRARSRDLRTPRSYDSREGTTSDGDRPVNAHEMPTAGRQMQTGIF